MFKWVFVGIALLVANIAVKPMLKDTQQVMVTDELAVAQLEDSDANFITMRANTRLQNMIDPIFWVGTVAILGVMVYSDRKKIKVLVENFDD